MQRQKLCLATWTWEGTRVVVSTLWLTNSCSSFAHCGGSSDERWPKAAASVFWVFVNSTTRNVPPHTHTLQENANLQPIPRVQKIPNGRKMYHWKDNKHEITTSLISQSRWLVASFVASSNLIFRTLASAHTSCGAAYHFHVIKSKAQEGGETDWALSRNASSIRCDVLWTGWCRLRSLRISADNNIFPHSVSGHINPPVCGKIKRPVALLDFCCIWMWFACGVQLAVHLHPDTVSADSLRLCCSTACTLAHLPLWRKQHGCMDETSTWCTKRWLYANKLTNYQTTKPSDGCRSRC